MMPKTREKHHAGQDGALRMADNSHEDLIEATIRRVAEAKAAQNALEHGDPEASVAAEAPASEELAVDVDAPNETSASVEESVIEATIRRVAEAKAAQGTLNASTEPVVEAVPADELDEGVPAEVDDGSIGRTPPAPAVDESLIEATIRRVAASNGAGNAAPSADEDSPRSETSPPSPGSLAEMMRGVAPAGGDWAAPHDGKREHAEPQQRIPKSFVPPNPRPREAVVAPDGDGDRRIAQILESTERLERAMAATNKTLAALMEKVNALAPPFQAGKSHAPPQSTPAQTAEEEWDEAPVVSRLPLTMPQRPAIFRDPAPLTATAEKLVEDVPLADERPLPQPLPPLQPELKRGFDLLPRTYRITVEDKRRGVDLVPLHRALLGMDGVRDMSLLSYSNGVAIVSLETVNDIDTTVLEAAVSRAMSRSARVETHNERTLVVKLAEE